MSLSALALTRYLSTHNIDVSVSSFLFLLFARNIFFLKKNTAHLNHYDVVELSSRFTFSRMHIDFKDLYGLYEL